jgi:putative aminopeptidase
MDEPGYVAGNVTKNGYLQLQRLPQFGLLPLFNELYSAQPVGIETASGKWVNGVVAGLSVHLLDGRTHPPDPRDIGNMYVDLGAATAAQAREQGVRVLDPVIIDRTLYELGDGRLAAAAVGDRFGDAALVEVLDHLNRSHLTGTLTVAFVAQQWTGARGLERVLERFKPDELIDVGRLLPSGGGFGVPHPAHFPSRLPGSGVLAGVRDPSAAFTGLAADLHQIAAHYGISFSEDYSAPLMPPSYLPTPPLPACHVHLAIPIAWPSTPAETIDSGDLSELVVLLEDYLQGSAVRPVFPQAHVLSPPLLPARAQAAPSPETIVKELVETYGVSGHEASVREAIERLLPPWAKPHTDDAGNLALHLAAGPASVPRILFVAHMDEIGFEVQSILSDGHLDVRTRGGGLPYFYLGHVCFVHTAQGIRPGVMELPDGWNQPGFKWPRGPGMLYRVDVGVQNASEVQALGIKTGDFITIPKKYRRSAGSSADARSFDDRVGDSALIAAVWALGPNLKDRNVTFAWSTGEELGLVGAAKMAARLAAEGEAPNYVFAVDTFVSSDSPLESKRFADARLGEGFVVRAIDNSNIVPANLVAKVLHIAHQDDIPVQYGVTGGGNDGSAFLKYGSTDVALGWPLRYSHSPGELIDTRDLDSLARAVAAIARSW